MAESRSTLPPPMENYQKANGITDFACFSDDSHWMMNRIANRP